MTVLKIEDLNFTYHSKERETKAVDGVNVAVEEGEFVGIVGPSGCGKSTILNVLAGIYRGYEGKITLCGKDLKESDGKIALMPQRDQLFEWRTIEKNVLLGPEITGKKSKETVLYANELLRKYGLGETLKKRPSELSGGMRQRVALIRTLVLHPDVLLLDEPFSALDFQTRLNVCDDVYSIIKQEKKTALLVSHDISECISLCDKVIVLSRRPATVVDVIEIDLDKSLSPLKRRECPHFGAYFEKIWKNLEAK
ncbi:MAG: ABC transporter ATP-binding protein [Clostridia bacterium]|nr:ABC transporter ATP-binding protein [Clostridia bacterium]